MTVLVSDPAGAITDPALPMLRRALEPGYMSRKLGEVVPSRGVSGVDAAAMELRSIHVRRHKPGRRCLVEYRLARASGDGEHALAILGKVRARGVDRRSHELQEVLHRDAFGAGAPDRIAVPEPLGLLPEVAMWLQRKVAGESVMAQLTGAEANGTATRIVEVALKLQREGPKPRRRHGIDDELRVLRHQLARVAEYQPAWRQRLRRILMASEHIGTLVPGDGYRPSHRDYYPDNLIADGGTLHLIDLDLYCAADPALDIANFIGHVVEFSLRTRGDPDALNPIERALESAFLARLGRSRRVALHVYTTLTLVRHIGISTRIPARRHLTRRLMALCERRLGVCGC